MWQVLLGHPVHSPCKTIKAHDKLERVAEKRVQYNALEIRFYENLALISR